MRDVKVQLKSIDDVKNFVQTASQFTSDIDLVSGRYIIDAKSILGIFSLDLGQPITLRIADDKDAPAIIEAMDAYLVD